MVGAVVRLALLVYYRAVQDSFVSNSLWKEMVLSSLCPLRSRSLSRVPIRPEFHWIIFCVLIVVVPYQNVS